MLTTTWKSLVVVSALGGVVLVAGCSSKEAAPAPMLGDCEGEGCKPSGGNGGGTKPGDGAGGSDSPDASTSVTVSGTVVSTVDHDFANVAAYTGVAVVHARGKAGADVFADTAAGQFTVDDVATGLNWFALEDRQTQRNLMPTLQPVVVDADEPQAQVVGVEQQAFSAVLAGLNPTQIPLDSNAHAILFFVNEGGQPVKGVTLTGWAHAETVAYDSVPAYEVASPPDSFSTGEKSTALLINIPAGPFPGSSVDIRFQVSGEDFTAPVQVASGYVTRAAITAVKP